MDRSAENIAEQVSRLQSDLEELKSTQFFGGDALIVNEFEAVLANDSSMEYSLTLTPSNPSLGVLPSAVELKWTNPNMNSQATVGYYSHQVYRTDGVFEWCIVGSHSDYFTTSLLVQWIGKGTINLERVS